MSARAAMWMSRLDYAVATRRLVETVIRGLVMSSLWILDDNKEGDEWSREFFYMGITDSR